MTANGTEISDGASLSGSQVLRVYGSNLTPPYFSLWFNGVEYTPLDYGDGYVEYVLQDNGTYEIRNEADVVMDFEIEGVVIPSELPKNMTMWQSASATNPFSNPVNQLINRGNCINYAKQASQELPSFLFRPSLGDSIDEINRFGLFNCEIVKSNWQENTGIVLGLVPTNADEHCWVTWDGFIIAVFNYTTTP